jgi:hypothetical protein
MRHAAAPEVRAVPPRRLWWLGAGFVVWCSALVFLYALHAIGCTFGWPSGPLRGTLAVVLLVHLAAIGWMWRGLAGSRPDAAQGDSGDFVHTVVIWTLIAAMAASLITFAPSLLLATCV